MRTVSKDKYIAAAVITLCIFLLGLFLGFVIEGKRINYMQEQGQEQKVVFESLQLQYLFVDQLGQEDNCDAMTKTFDISVKDLEAARVRLEQFDNDAKITKDNFDLLKREYTLAQLRYWLLAKKNKALCDTNLTTILYFYSTQEKCADCEEQAFILTYLKKLFGQNLLIFSFDSDFEEEPMISILKNTYGVTDYPTLLIEDEVQKKFISKDDLLEKICSHYENNTNC